MTDESKAVAGQQQEPAARLCGDCEFHGDHNQCQHEKSERWQGMVLPTAAACKLFRHV